MHVNRLQGPQRAAGPRVFENVFDQPVHACGRRDDLSEIVVAVCVEAIAILLREQLAIARDRQQRRAQVMGDDRREFFEFAVAAGELFGAERHRLLQIGGITIDALEARAVNVLQQLARIAQFLEVRECPEVQGLLDRVVGGAARVDDHADLLVNVADAFQQLGSAQIGKAVIDHRHVKVALLHVFQCLGGGTAADDVEFLLLQSLAQQAQLVRIVFNHQHIGKAIGWHRGDSSPGDCPNFRVSENGTVPFAGIGARAFRPPFQPADVTPALQALAAFPSPRLQSGAFLTVRTL